MSSSASARPAAGSCACSPTEAAKGSTDPKANPNPFFSDVRVRRAIRMAIDVDKITSSVWYGYAQPVWTEFFRPPYNTCNIPRPTFDVAGAKALLDQAGWVMGSNGIRVCKNCGTPTNGTPFKFNLLTYSEYGRAAHPDPAADRRNAQECRHRGRPDPGAGQRPVGRLHQQWHRADAATSTWTSMMMATAASTPPASSATTIPAARQHPDAGLERRPLRESPGRHPDRSGQ